MRYLDLFTGIGAACVAWRPLGWELAGWAEIEPFACEVTRTRHHDALARNLGDVSKIKEDAIAELGPLDVVVGGSPCQDLSVAKTKREGLAGKRSRLFYEQVRIFDAARDVCGARWLLWENVAGALSTHRGGDFACVVGALSGNAVGVPPDGWQNTGVALGPRGLVEWCVLDAQWFGVPQRRRRVFALLDTGNWADRPPILFDAESLCGNHPPRREEGEGVAPALSARATAGGGLGTDFDIGGLVSGAVSAKWVKGTGGPAGDECYNLVPFDTTQMTSKANRSNPQPGDPSPPLSQSGHPPSIAGRGVRRLTPRECERLMGLPDDYTRVMYRNRAARDGPRYKALGNSMAVPVLRWIAQRMEQCQQPGQT